MFRWKSAPTAATLPQIEGFPRTDFRLAQMRNPLPLECWAQFRDGEATADFKAVPGEEALKTIKAEHVPRLIRIFQQWKAGADFKALRITAMKELLS